MVGQEVCTEGILCCQPKWKDIWDRYGTASPRFSHVQYFYSCPRRWNREDVQMAASREGLSGVWKTGLELKMVLENRYF